MRVHSGKHRVPPAARRSAPRYQRRSLRQAEFVVENLMGITRVEFRLGTPAAANLHELFGDPFLAAPSLLALQPVSQRACHDLRDAFTGQGGNFVREAPSLGILDIE